MKTEQVSEVSEHVTTYMLNRRSLSGSNDSTVTNDEQEILVTIFNAVNDYGCLITSFYIIPRANFKDTSLRNEPP